MLVDQPSSWAACTPFSPALSIARRSPSPSSRLRIVGSRSRMCPPVVISRHDRPARGGIPPSHRLFPERVPCLSPGQSGYVILGEVSDPTEYGRCPMEGTEPMW